MASALSGKVALVTGAGSGIGRAACQILARDGAAIIAADQNFKTVQETISLIKSSSQKHISCELDVRRLDSVKSVLAKAMDTFKAPPTIIVNSAGITRDNFIPKLSEAHFDEVIEVNLKGTFLVMQTFTNAILEHKLKNASVVNIASIIGKNGNIGQANYAASKAGVELITKTAAKELGKFGIRVNVILPGFINTPMTKAVPDKLKAEFLANIAIGRFGNPEEVAEVISFLASDKSSYIHGASIEITGGL